MTFARVYSAQNYLLRPHLVTIEVDIAKNTLHSFSLVGLPSKEVEEARDRISAAIKNTGFTSPKQTNQKVVISLAPADIKKSGPLFDVGMALAYLLADSAIAFESAGKLFVGELGLDGSINPIKGILSICQYARTQGFSEIYVPSKNAREAALIDDIAIYPMDRLVDVIGHLNTKKLPELIAPLIPSTQIEPQKKTTIPKKNPRPYSVTIDDVRGQETAKRGLEIAAAGGHNIALYGPPGTGKTLLAKAFCSLLPELSFPEILEVTGIHSAAGTLETDLVIHPPFRSPHHTASYVSLVGGGGTIKPGEITLAHRGVLFLDEFPEFEKRVIESLRQPLEERSISISRAKGSAVFPADFILLAALNPCPCGNKGSTKECVCTPSQTARYERKLSGPIVDRIDLWIEVPLLDYEKLSAPKESNAEQTTIKTKIAAAREYQKQRFKSDALNSHMGVRDIEALDLTSELLGILNTSARHLDLSPRAYHRTLKLARTIADLDQSSTIEKPHLFEALQYRKK